MLPDNLHLTRFVLAPAAVPGLGRFWAVYERLDRGEIIHSRYCGQLPGVPGETTEALYSRAAALFGSKD